MRVVRIMLISIISSVLMSFAPVPMSAAPNEFFVNGDIASQIETKLQDFVMSKEMDGFKYSIYQQGVDYTQGQGYVSSNPKKDFVDRHLSIHCSPSIKAEKEGFNCKGPVGVVAEDKKYFEMGDIKFSVLLDPEKYTEGTSLMAQLLIRNIINPFPDNETRDFVSSGSLDDNKQRDAYADYMASQAKLGVALYSMNELYGMRVTGASLGITEPEAVANNSVMSTMETELTRRFFGEKFGPADNFEAWLQDTNTKQVDVVKEMARMRAVRLWMEFLRYRQGERIESLIATGVAQAVNSAQETKKMFSGAGG